MVAPAPGRTRPLNVAIPFDHSRFIMGLLRATRWDKYQDALAFIGDDDFIPGSPQGEWRVDNPGQFSVDYLWREMLSKYDDGKSSTEKQDNALKKFAEAEELCKFTNTRFARMGIFPAEYARGDVETVLSKARSNMHALLGRLDMNEVADGFTFTSGASTRLPKTEASSAYKYSGTPETTFDNLALAVAAITATPAWKRSLSSEEGPMHIAIVRGNKVITVPKNYKADRVIAVEPDMNMYVQKGFGAVIRRRLRLAGMDINSQERNQKLARIGSSAGTLATIDLSMASDSVSLELVRWLLPHQWVEALEQCRSLSGVLPSGEKILYRKFSSMGNGYTFELETAIFYCLALAVCTTMGLETHRTVCYGDDIIVPTAAAPLLISVLEFCGFKVNEDKSFVEGPFRESCGKHYCHGNDVTPFYIKNKVEKLIDLFLLHNRLSRWAERNHWNTQVDRAAMYDLLGWLRSLAPRNWRKPRIPDGYGDGAFIGTFDECTPKSANTFKPGRVGKRDGWEGFTCEVLSEVAEIADFYDGDSDAAPPVFGTRKGAKGPVKPRPKPPVYEGRLLQSLASLPKGRRKVTDPVRDIQGGVPMPPRYQLVTLVVQQFVQVQETPVTPLSIEWELLPFSFSEAGREIEILVEDYLESLQFNAE